MCPACLAAVGLYVAGGVSAGGLTTYLAARVLRATQPKTTPESRREAR